jgi:hypothetical protein
MLPLLDEAVVDDASSNIKLGISSGTVSNVDNVVVEPKTSLDNANLNTPDCRLKSIIFDLHRVYAGLP